MQPSVASLICGIGIAGPCLSRSRREKTRVSHGPCDSGCVDVPEHYASAIVVAWNINQGIDAAQTYVDGSPFDRNFTIFLQLAALAVLRLAKAPRPGQCCERIS